MLFRTTSRTVTFRMPFSIAAVERELPAGAYLVETDEELIQGLSFPAYRRVATLLQIPSRGASGGLQSVPVDPEELDAALVRDALAHGTAERPAGEGGDVASGA